MDYLVKASRECAAVNKMLGSIRSRMKNTEKIVTPYISQCCSLIWIPAAGFEGVQH